MADQLDVDAVAARCRDLVVEELLKDRRLRREILLAIARETVTRDDIRMLREEVLRVERELRGEVARVEKELRAEIARVERELRSEMARMEKTLLERVARVEGQLSLFIRLFIAFNVPLLVAVIGILLKMVWG